MRKGIILAAGSASRLNPTTKYITKHLLPVYDKPMINYSLSVLMLANIRNILLICNMRDLSSFKDYLGDGKRLGINISYEVQEKPDGIAKAFIIGEKFIDTIKMQLSDLENFAHLGYADGVSKIFVQGINALDIHLRPIHCSDSKRETLYIKDNNEWVKETDDKPLIKSAIKRVAFKNIKQINEWIKENPECKDPTTKKYDKYNKIVMNSMSGGTIEEQQDNIEKIVKNVTKAVAIEKYALK